MRKLLLSALLAIMSVAGLKAAPPVPTALTATAIGNTTADLSWYPVSGAYSFNLYQDGSLLSSPSSSMVRVTGLAPGTTHSYGVASVDQNGSASATSAYITITTQGGSTANMTAVYNAPGTALQVAFTGASGTASTVTANQGTAGASAWPVSVAGVATASNQVSLQNIAAQISGSAATTAANGATSALQANGNLSLLDVQNAMNAFGSVGGAGCQTCSAAVAVFAEPALATFGSGLQAKRIVEVDGAGNTITGSNPLPVSATQGAAGTSAWAFHDTQTANVSLSSVAASVAAQGITVGAVPMVAGSAVAAGNPLPVTGSLSITCTSGCSGGSSASSISLTANGALVSNSNPLPVSAPALVTTVTLGSAASNITITCDGFSQLSFFATGASTGTFTFQGSPDGTNWQNVNAYVISGTSPWTTSTTSLTTGQTNIYYVPNSSAFHQFRVQNAWASGSITFTFYQSTGSAFQNLASVTINGGSISTGQLGLVTFASNGSLADQGAASDANFQTYAGDIMMNATITASNVNLTSTAGVLLYTPPNNRKFRVMGYEITLSDFAAAASSPIVLSLLDNTTSTAGTVIAPVAIDVPAVAATTFGPGFRTGWIDLKPIGYNSSANNNTLSIKSNTTLTGGTISVNILGLY